MLMRIYIPYRLIKVSLHVSGHASIYLNVEICNFEALCRFKYQTKGDAPLKMVNRNHVYRDICLCVDNLTLNLRRSNYRRIDEKQEL